MWLPWTLSTVWEALEQSQALAYWAHLYCCREQDGALAPGDILLWRRNTPLLPFWRLLKVEYIAPSHSICLHTQAGKYQKIVRILLEPAEGGEITRIEVSGEMTSSHTSWFLLPLLKLVMYLSITRALRRLDALLEHQQA